MGCSWGWRRLSGGDGARVGRAQMLIVGHPRERVAGTPESLAVWAVLITLIMIEPRLPFRRSASRHL